MRIVRLLNRIKNGGEEIFLNKHRGKIFCIGRNKTGTTSLKQTFKDLGFKVGNQRRAELLLRSFVQGDYKPIVEYCVSAQVFQDFPFSFPPTFEILDKAYPGSKFILSVRDSPEQWYNSLVSFHSKVFGNGKIPTKNDLMAAEYVWKGWAWECFSFNYRTSDNDPYNKDLLIEHYNKYNAQVIDYFKGRPSDLIVINVAEPKAYCRLMTFLEIRSPFSDFPWKNRTIDLKT